MGQIFGIFSSFVIGRLADKLSVKISLPLAHILRGSVFFLSFHIKDPNSWLFYIIAPLQNVVP